MDNEQFLELLGLFGNGKKTSFTTLMDNEQFLELLGLFGNGKKNFFYNTSCAHTATTCNNFVIEMATIKEEESTNINLWRSNLEVQCYTLLLGFVQGQILCSQNGQCEEDILVNNEQCNLTSFIHGNKLNQSGVKCVNNSSKRHPWHQHISFRMDLV